MKIRRPWTLRLVALGSAKVVAYSAGFEAPEFWTRRAAARKAHELNSEASHHRNYLWRPARNERRKPW